MPMNLPFAFKVIREYVPLHTKNALAPDAPELEFRATQMPCKIPVKLARVRNENDIFEAWRTSARQPLNDIFPVSMKGRQLVDAGFSDPFCLEGPYRDASDTRYVLFSNQPKNAPDPKIPGALDFVPFYPTRSELLDARHRAIRLRGEMEKAGRLLVLYPSQTILSTDTDTLKLEAGAQDGMRVFCQLLAKTGGKIPMIERTVERLPEGSYENKVPMFRLQF